MKLPSTILFILILSVSTLQATKKNPLQFTAKSINQGKQEFKTSCISCHGFPTEGKSISPDIPDVGSKVSLAKKDTELYDVLTNGVNAMPGFKQIIPEHKRWAIINYIRSFDPTMKNRVIGKLTFPKIDISAKLLEKQKIVEYQISELKKNRKYPLANLDVNLYAKRMFGKIPLFDKSLKTNKKGWLAVTVPDNVIGDANGNVEIIAEIADADTYGEVMVSVSGKLAKAMQHKNILKKRCLWGTSSKLPIWLFCSYLGVLIIVFGGLVLIIVKLLGLRKLN